MPSMLNTALFGLLATAAKVAAHGFVDEINVDGTSYTGYLVTSYPYQANPPASVGWSETSTDLGFVAPSQFAGPDIICHNGAKNAALSAPVKAGGSVTAHWNTWPDSHKGPAINYLAACNGDCATVDKTTLKFFKIQESGFENGVWATDALMANNFSETIKIPSSIAPGGYVLRHELWGLHSAGQADGAQAYPFCFNLEVSGTGTDAPEGTLGTALYTPTDPGVLVSIYSNDLQYDIPGPALYTGGSGSGEAPPAAPPAPEPSAPAPSAPAPTSAPVAAPTAPAAPVPTSPPVDDDEYDTCE